MSKDGNLDPRIQELCERLKQIRIDRGYKSYEHFALDNGLGRMSVWRVENGSNLTLQTLFRYLDLHGLSLEEFVVYGKLETIVSPNGKH